MARRNGDVEIVSSVAPWRRSQSVSSSSSITLQPRLMMSSARIPRITVASRSRVVNV